MMPACAANWRCSTGDAIEGTGFAPRTVAKSLSDIAAQEREVQELLLPVADFVPQVKVTDDMVKAFTTRTPSSSKCLSRPRSNTWCSTTTP
jgi:hypothetical protein